MPVVVAAVSREGRRITLSGVRVPFARGTLAGEVLVEVATFGLPRSGGAPGLERASARVTMTSPEGAVEMDVAVEREHGLAPDLGWCGAARAVGRVRSGDVALPIELRARLLLDEDRVWVHDLEGRAPGVALRGDASSARGGGELRGRAAGTLRPAALLAALGAPRVTCPASDAELSVALSLTGSVAEPACELRARAETVALPLGRPRFVPPSRLEQVDADVTLGPRGLVARARARAGEGVVEAVLTETADASVSVTRWPLRFFDGAWPLSPSVAASLERVLATGTLEGRLVRSGGTGVAFDLEVDLSAPPPLRAIVPGECRGRVAARGRVTGPAAVELRITSPGARVGIGPEASLDVDAVDAVARVVLEGDRQLTVSIAPATVTALGGRLELEAELRLRLGGALTGEVRAHVEDLDATALELASGVGRSALRLARAPSSDRATRPRGTAWLPATVRVSGDARVVLPATVHAELRARTGGSDVHAVARVADGRALEARLSGQLAISEAIDLGFFDGGTHPERDGDVELALRLAGTLASPGLSGGLRAAKLRFGPHVLFEEVEALVSARDGVAVWGEARARLAGGRVSLVALVDRAGDLGGMRAHVEVVDVDLEVLSAGEARGRLELEVALEQHGPDDAPLHGDGVVVVRGGAAPGIVRRLEDRLPAGLAARNAAASGELSARLSLDPLSVRLLGLALPLPDAWIGGDVRVDFAGALEAHLDVHARGLVAVPVRLRAAAGGLAPTLDVDVVAAALVGAATARASRASPPRRPVRHEAVAKAVASIDWAELARRARGST